MFGKLSAAVLLVASPALANDPAPAAEAHAQEYKIKKVCRTVEVAGSFIPRRSCVNKKIPIQKPEAETPDEAKAEGIATEGSGQEQ